ncbi:hypothetical protein WR25_26256 [Diploscapter pachys]|uniref:Uncharacterized protein n=1 Tax=Diploscapter pachys TaxID=2018661 RepID=A0A2A2JSY6_9BILA|nr:hypothetical protein WR25_26256 [Diploscapter pachys]
MAGWSVVITPHAERLQNRRTGDNFLVVCKVKDFEGAASDVKIEWFKDNKILPKFGSVMTIERPYSNQLMINRPKISDGGDYECRVDINGEKQEVSADISFVDPPKFIDPDTEQHPEEGTKAEIKCQVEGTDQMEVFWQFNGVTLDETHPRKYEFSDDKQTLIIPNFEAEKDDGIYNCNAAQYSSFETLSINVTGYSAPEITAFEGPSKNLGFEGHDIELKCAATGKPIPLYQWYFEDSDEELVDTDKYKVDGGLLIIESATENDAGKYKCIANNTVGESEKVFDLQIYLKPKVEVLHEVTKKEGEDVELICSYSGEGQLKAQFVYGNQVFRAPGHEEDREEEETPKPDNEDDDDDDDDKDQGSEETTTTVAQNSQEEESDNEIKDQSQEQDENGEEAETQNEKEDDENQEGQTEQEESARRRKRSESERYSVYAEGGNKLILRITDISLEDAGDYKCLVENEAGVSNRSTAVNIIHPPTLRHYSGPKIRSYDGNTVTIFCDVSAVPAPKWIWIHDGDEVEADGTSIVLDNKKERSELTLTTKKGQNYGKFTCKADNGVGKIEKTIEVVRIAIPPTPREVDCKKMVTPNYGRCFFADGLYDDEESRPTEMEFAIANMEDMEGDFDWKDARVERSKFENETIVPNLKPNSQYMVRVRAINEAGESEFSEETALETTNPWAPEPPEIVTMECEERCTVEWSVPNDHGAEITGYRIIVQELASDNEDNDDNIANSEETTTADSEDDEEEEEKNASEEMTTAISSQEKAESQENQKEEEESDNEKTGSQEFDDDTTDKDSESDSDKNRQDIGTPFVVEVGPEENQLELTHIKPHTYYRVSVAAQNEVGWGEATQIEHETDDKPTETSELFSTTKIAIAAGVALLFLLLVIDLICYALNGCGVIACICLNCLGRRANRREKDVEAGRGGESGHLLEKDGAR